MRGIKYDAAWVKRLLLELSLIDIEFRTFFHRSNAQEIGIVLARKPRPGEPPAESDPVGNAWFGPGMDVM